MKTCSKCGCQKDRQEFYADKRELDGLRHACKDCIRAARKRYYMENHEACKQQRKAWVQKNADRIYETNKSWRQANKDKSSAYARKWQRANPGRCADIKVRRRAAGACAWANKEKIAEIYAFAKELRDAGMDVHVDHIIPLRGKDASGLHVEHNLRVCLATVNLQKGNRQLEIHQ